MTTIAHRSSIPSGPPSPQPSASTTSTLISPSPIKTMVDSRRASLLKSLVNLKIEGEDERGGPKARGNIEPHISNLPRRRRRQNITPALAQDKSTMSMLSTDKQEALSSSRPLSRADADADGEIEETRDSVPQPGNAMPVEPPQNPLPQITPTSAPALMNLPRRRRKPLTPEQLVIQRAYRRCLQEIGEGSGVFVAFTEVDDEEEQGTQSLRKLGGEDFKYVVRVSVSEERRIHKVDECTMWLFVPSDVCYDDGNTHLDEQQLRVACRFLGILGGKDQVLITTPRDRAADGMSLAILYLAISRRFITPIPTMIEHPTPAVAAAPLASTAVTPHPSYMLSRTSSSVSQQGDADSAIHSLLMYLHDLSCDDLEEAYGHVMSSTQRPLGALHKSKAPGWKLGSGLRLEWRGTLSREGIDFLDDVLEMLRLELLLPHTTI